MWEDRANVWPTRTPPPPGGDVGEKDNQVGTLTSREFTLDRDYVTFWIGGGSHAGATCLNLIVDGKPVLTATGQNDNRMRIEQFDVRHLQGKSCAIADRGQPGRAVGQHRRGRNRAERHAGTDGWKVRRAA